MPAQDHSQARPREGTWRLDLLVGVLFTAFGVWEAWSSDGYDRVAQVLVVLGFSIGAALYRRAPGLALLLVWLASFVQLLSPVPVMFVQVGVVVVAFGCARWGSAPVVWASGLSIPAAGLIGAGYVRAYGVTVAGPMSKVLGLDPYGANVSLDSSVTVLGLLAATLLAVPWLLGLLLRIRSDARTSRDAQRRAEAEGREAVDVARLREEQARLARDVHDVVGHSLAVILAQAESAQYLADPDDLRRTLATVATSARTSLQDVRSVLSSDSPANPGDLDRLVDGVRASGHPVAETTIGVPRPLPPELAQVAHRVLQEMLTNAIRHGSRDEPVVIERRWGDQLCLEVRNAIPVPRPEPDPGGGQGLEGMRRRLASVGGRLETADEGTTFRVTAYVPVRAVVA